MANPAPPGPDEKRLKGKKTGLRAAKGETHTNRKTRATSSGSIDFLAPDEHDSHANTRQWRNRVGKRYRDKLNGQFESLQAALLGKMDDDDPDDREPIDAKNSTTNKAKVLDMARERILVLLREREALQAEREALLQGSGQGLQ